MRPLIFLAVCTFTSFMASASPWVEVNKVVTDVSANEKNITFSYSWPFENEETIVSECNSGCVIGVFFEGGKLYNIDLARPLTILASDNCNTMKCIWNKWIEKYSTGILTSTWKTTQAGADTGCWSFLVFPYSSSSNVTGTGTRLPGVGCAYPPPESVFCSLSSIPDFDHGSLTNTNLEGSIVTQRTILNCNAASKVDIYMAYGDAIELGEKNSGLSSEIYIEGSAASRSNPVTVNASAGDTNLTIESRLQSSGPIKAGEYSGSGVLILDVN